MRTGLVLGAGGATAWVFHTAVLQTLRDEHAFAYSDAEVVIGTSAGSSLAATLRAGTGLEDFYQLATRPPTEDQRAAMLAELKKAPKTVVPLSSSMARNLLPGGEGAALGLAGLLPPGLFPTTWLADLPGMHSFDTWPEGLWIPAVRVPDGEIVVFGKDRLDVPVALAVQASSAVPGMFRPVQIDGELYVDGGVKSSTHANLLADSGVDRVIISAPMSRSSGGPYSRNARRRLADEVGMLRSAGINTVVIEPSDALNEIAKGYPRRRPEAAPEIAKYAVSMTRLALAAG